MDESYVKINFIEYDASMCKKAPHFYQQSTDLILPMFIYFRQGEIS